MRSIERTVFANSAQKRRDYGKIGAIFVLSLRLRIEAAHMIRKGQIQANGTTAFQTFAELAA